MKDRSGLPLRAAGVLLLAVPFLPPAGIFGRLRGASALVGPGEWTLGLAIFVVVAWLVALVAGRRTPSLAGLAGRLDRGGDGAWLGAGVAALAALLVGASWGAFHRSPHLIDSVVQLFQAKIFAAGVLEAPAPPGGGFFTTQHMIVDAGGWYSQYPPGHAALLAAGVAAGAAWAAPVALSLGTAAWLYAAVRRMYGHRCARLTLLLLVLCPFFWFMGASFMNHVSALFFVSAFLYLFVRWEEEGGAALAAAAGAALGAAALSRPLTAAALAVPFAAFAVASRRSGPGPARRETQRTADGGGAGPDGAEAPGVRGTVRRWAARLGPVAAAGAGFAAVASLYLLYNAEVTGDPLLPGYVKLWGESHGLGFHATPWGGEHTPLAGLRDRLLDLSLLNLFLFEWPVPALLPAGAAFALGWTTRGWDRRLLVAFLTIPAAYFFYWHRDTFLGPRFLYAGLAFLVPLTARAVLEAGERLEGRSAQVGELFRPVDAGRWAAALLLLCAAYAAVYAVPQRFRVYARGMPSMKEDVVREARAAGVERGLIFVKVSWGNRLIARLRGLGVPAAEVERAYRTVSHCRLERLVRTASAGDWPAERIRREIATARRRDRRLVTTPRLNGDPTLLVRRGAAGLTERCREQIRYDRRGYTVYSPHLVANRPALDGPFVVARDLRARNPRLRRRFPGRPVFLYDGERLRPLGRPREGP